MEQECLGLVVFVMSYGDALSLQEGFHFSKPFVSQIACRHLDADVLLQCMFLGGEMLDIEGDTCIAAKILDKFLISVGFFASELKVGVQGFHQVPQIMQDEQERHRVGTPTDSNQYRIAWREQLMLLYVLTYSMSHLILSKIPCAMVSPSSTAFCKCFFASAVLPCWLRQTPMMR